MHLLASLLHPQDTKLKDHRSSHKHEERMLAGFKNVFIEL